MLSSRTYRELFAVLVCHGLKSIHASRRYGLSAGSTRQPPNTTYVGVYKLGCSSSRDSATAVAHLLDFRSTIYDIILREVKLVPCMMTMVRTMTLKQNQT